MQPIPINELVFKGTHNSYSCTGEDTPAMNHPTEVQIDDFGVWALELDYGVKLKAGVPTALVGHDDEGQATCFMNNGFELVQLLRSIRNTRALEFRPIFIFFDIKPWDQEFTRDFKLSLGRGALQEVFGEDFVELRLLVDQQGRFPSVPELAGKAVLYFPGDTLRGSHADHCVSRESVENSIATGIGVEDPAESCGSEGCRVFRLDQYQGDWTFDYGVPPNPIVIDGSAQVPAVVQDAQGDEWDCDNGDVSHGEVVSEQGTDRFPYKTVGRAIDRVEGTTPNGFRDPRRSGLGWTVLVRPGIYPESLRVDIPLTLRKDERFAGTVVIVGQRERMVRCLFVTFHTNDDNKDADTALLVRIVSSTGRILAEFRQNRNKEYKDGFTHCEQLQLLGPVFESEIRNGTLNIDIAPNGDDTWRFDWRLNGTWSDGIPFSDAQAGIDLDEETRHFEKALTI